MHGIRSWRSVVTSLVVALSAGVSASAHAADKLVVTAFGGIWEQSMQQNFGMCFKEKTGKEIAIQLGDPAAWLAKLRANPNHPPIDVVMMPEAGTTRAIRAGMLDPIEADKLPNLKYIPAEHYQRWQNQAIDFHIGTLGVLYNKSVIKEVPKDWKTLFDNIAAGKYGKHVSMPGGTYAWGPDVLWFVGNTYGGNIDTAFTKMKAMQPSVVKFWTDPSEALNLFATHQVDLLLYWDGRAHDFIEKGNDWAAYYNPAPKSLSTAMAIAKVKNGNPDAWVFINCVLDAQQELKHAQLVGYPVTNTQVVYPPKLKERMTPESDMLFLPYDKYVDQFPEWIDRWNREMR